MHGLNRRLAGLTCFLMILSSAYAGDQAKKQDTGKQNKNQAFVDAYTSAFQAGPQHERLRRLTGTWDVLGRMRFGPGDPWEPIDATLEAEMVMDNLFLSQRITAEKSASWPVPYRGLRLLGYNTFTKKFENVVMCNLGTNILFLQGALDDQGKTISLAGRIANPMTGKEEPWRTKYRFLSDDRFVLLEMPQGPNGKPYIGIEAVYTRRRTTLLLGKWTGRDRQGHEMSFEFRANGRARWSVETPDGPMQFDLRFALDASREPFLLELDGFTAPPLAGKTMFGIVRMSGNDAFDLDLEPGPRGSTGREVRPKQFTDDTVRFTRKEGSE